MQSAAAFSFRYCLFFSYIFLTVGFIFLSSPHIQTIRERISLGRFGEPVSAKTLNCLFLQIKKILDQAIEHENGRISHFEVSTCVRY